jgi:hypothetical protein
MASITFYGGGGPYAIANMLNSGIGFFGANFGESVAVAAYQTTTFITDGNGTQDGGQINNVTYENTASGTINGAAAVHLKQIPNYLATLNVRFEHGSVVKTQNAKWRIYDRTAINNDPSGVTCQVYETLHHSVTQSLAEGSGANVWTNVHGSAVIMSLADSPGTSGTSPAGASTTDTRHDWYMCLSPSPNSIGSKNLFGGYISLEYL